MSDSSDDENDYQDKFETLTDDIKRLFDTTNEFGVRLDNIEGRLDNIDTLLHAILFAGASLNVPRAGGGKHRKRTRGKSRKKKRTRKRGKSMRKRKRTRYRK